MPKCNRCGKDLSTQQALQTHMKSRSCVQRTNSDEKLHHESYAIIECSNDGKILGIEKKSFGLSPSPRMMNVTGKYFYDILHEDIEKKYDMARLHINLLAQPDLALRCDNVKIKELSINTLSYNIIMKIQYDRLMIYVNK